MFFSKNKYIHQVNNLLQDAFNYHQQGNIEAAIEVMEKALRINPGNVDVLYNLGNFYFFQHNLEKAKSTFESLIDNDPENAEACHNLGSVLKKMGDLETAKKLYQKALNINPDLAVAYYNLGSIFGEQGNPEQAKSAYLAALKINPELVEAYNNLGMIFYQQYMLDEAIDVYKKALQIRPDAALTYNNLGLAYQAQGNSTEAYDAYKKSLELIPDYAEALNNMGFYFQENSDQKQAINYFKRAISIKPDFYVAHSNLLFSMTYSYEVDAEEIFKEHCNWARQHTITLNDQDISFTNKREQGRKLRVGYLSPDFRLHSVAYFMEPVFSEYNQNEFETIAYSNTLKPDDTTLRLKNLVDDWRDTIGMTDTQLINVIRDDKVDILVDLAGHTTGNRLNVFSNKPAPVQISYLGYPNTTGISAIDYRISDKYADAPGITERYFTEELVRLPDSFLCYKPPVDCPDVGILPAIQKGHVTFGCFNNPAKLNVEIIAIWSELLCKLPGAKLLLKGRHFRDENTQKFYINKFKQHGVRDEHIIFYSLIPSYYEHMNLYNNVDIALDTFPYNGTTTTCEALWMGVPVITLAGQVHQSCVGKSILTNVGLQQFIAKTPEEFIETTISLASDPVNLSIIRNSLREKMENSTLTNAKQFTNNLENVYRDIWVRWCNKN